MTEPHPAARDADPGPTCRVDAAERLEGLWDRGLRPDPEGFLAEVGPLPPADLAAALRVDQRRRWEAGEPIPAEEYLGRFGAVRDDPEAVLDLIYGEYLLRERRGEPPDTEAFLRRFPGHADALRAQIELHRALDASTDPGSPGVTRAGDPDDGTWRLDSAATDPGELPRQFGRYRIEAFLGQGGMGRVYRAVDTRLGRPVALKVPRVGPGGDAVPVDRFYREARIAATFTHPNLCPVFDVGEQDGVHYLTMPLLEGETLADLLRRRGALPEPEAAAMACRIARAVQVAHEAGVVHRDLKPANVMLDPRGEPIVMDFGLARRTGGDAWTTAPGVLMGTPAYVSPEQVGGDPGAVGPAGDVYSLGVILYEMLSGRVPFGGPAHEVITQVLSCAPAPPSRHRPGLDRGLERVVLRTLAKPPGSRFASMAELAEALEAWAAGGAAEPATPASRRRVVRAVAAAGCVAALGFLTWVALTPRGPAARPGADPLPVGSLWAGTFRFRPPIADYSGDVELRVTERRGDAFRALYATEGGAYRWWVAGAVRGESIRWDFVEAIRDNPGHDVVGTAWVEGRIRGTRLELVYRHPGSGDADMELRLRP